MGLSGIKSHSSDSYDAMLYKMWNLHYWTTPDSRVIMKDPDLNSDSDELLNYEEFLVNSNPYDSDSDDDGYLDHWDSDPNDANVNVNQTYALSQWESVPALDGADIAAIEVAPSDQGVLYLSTWWGNIYKSLNQGAIGR